MKPIDDASRRLRAAGLRLTQAREALLQLMLSSAGPFSVKTLHERAESAGLAVHLATVHRNLDEFVKVGLVDEWPGEDNRLYALHQDQESSAHIFCLDCRQMMALQETALASTDDNEALNQAISQRGFDASTVRLMLAAHCKTSAAHACPRNPLPED
jgi:Fe2+ or Zn2+ uptake regulation protein